MKVLTLIFLLLFNLYALDDRRLLMESISEHAIRIGTGPDTTYTFLDPLCSKSQAFIEFISGREDLQEKISYYIFLYRLPRFESDKHIQYIYQSPDPLIALKEIMINYDDEDVYDIQVKNETLKKIESVSTVAEQIGMKRRPYLLIFNEGSNYCQVSEGTAPCLEENEFKD